MFDSLAHQQRCSPPRKSHTKRDLPIHRRLHKDTLHSEDVYFTLIHCIVHGNNIGRRINHEILAVPIMFIMCGAPFPLSNILVSLAADPLTGQLVKNAACLVIIRLPADLGSAHLIWSNRKAEAVRSIHPGKFPPGPIRFPESQ